MEEETYIYRDNKIKRYFRTTQLWWLKENRKRYSIIEKMTIERYELGKPDKASKRCKELNNPKLLF